MNDNIECFNLVLKWGSTAVWLQSEMLVNIGGQLFALVPAQSLDAGPEFFNSTFAPHNCVGGSEQGCVPGKPEAYYLFKDPSKMNREAR